MKIFAGQGVDGESAEHFISDMYKQCNRLGITPDNIVTHIADLKFLKEEKQLENLRDQPFIGPIIAELLRRGLTEDDIQVYGKLLLNISEGPHSLKRFALVMIDTIKTKANSRTRTASDDKTIEILGRAKEQLSILDSSQQWIGIPGEDIDFVAFDLPQRLVANLSRSQGDAIKIVTPFELSDREQATYNVIVTYDEGSTSRSAQIGTNSIDVELSLIDYYSELYDSYWYVALGNYLPTPNSW